MEVNEHRSNVRGEGSKLLESELAAIRRVLSKTVTKAGEVVVAGIQGTLTDAATPRSRAVKGMGQGGGQEDVQKNTMREVKIADALLHAFVGSTALNSS